MAMDMDIAMLSKVLEVTSRYKRGLQVLTVVQRRIRLMRWLDDWRAMQQHCRYEQELGKDYGSEAGFPEWFDDDMIDWVSQRQEEIEVENGVLLLN